MPPVPAPRMDVVKWSAAMEPWTRLLRSEGSAIEYTEHRRAAPRVSLSLNTYYHPMPQPFTKALQLREAVVLLQLVAIEDSDACRELLRKDCGCRPSFALMAELERPAPVRFRIRLGNEENAEVPFDTEFYHVFFFGEYRENSLARKGGLQDALVSPTRAQFELALQKILRNMPAEARERVRSNELFCPLTVDFCPPEKLRSKRVKPYLRGVAELIKKVNQASRESALDPKHGADAFPFVFDAITLDVRWLRMVPGSPAILAEIAELGGHVHEELSKVEIGHRSALWQLTTGEMGALMSPFVNHSSVRAIKSAHRIPRSFASVLHFSHTSARTATELTPLYVRKFEVVCSALAVAQEVDRVSFTDVLSGYFGEVRYKMWQWLAYAFFSNASAGSSVMSLSIEDGYFEEMDREAIMSVIQARCPAKLLLDYESLRDFDSEPENDGFSREEDDFYDDFYTISSDDEDECSCRLYAGDDGSECECECKANRAKEESDDKSECEDIELFYSEKTHRDCNDTQYIICDEDSTGTAELVFLKVGVSVKVCPLENDSEDLEFVSLKTSGVFEITRNDEKRGWVDVVVPGYGLCIVPRESIDCFLRYRLPRSKVYNGSISMLELNFTGDPDETLALPLILYLGPKLKSLSLNLFEITSECFGTILRGCPNLETFVVSSIENPAERELMRAYNEGGCQLSSLQIASFQSNDYTVQFIRTLQNPTSAAAIKLRKLALASEDFTERMLEAMAKMLEANTTLEHLQLTAPSEFADGLEPLFKSFDGQILSGNVPVSCRYALLSVVDRLGEHPRASGKQQKAPARKKAHLDRGEGLKALGQDVLALIFQFAKEPRVRRVQVTWSDFGYF